MVKKKRKPINKNLPQAAKQTHQQVKSVQAKAVSFSGPLPPPEVLQNYNQITPGAADRIITMAEKQSQHRQEIEIKVITSDIKNARLGLHYGLIIGLASVVGGVVCIISGYEIGGTILGGSGLSSLVGVFVYGSRQKRKEREKRLEIINSSK
jgi:uncharacterized membrane protein